MRIPASSAKTTPVLPGLICRACLACLSALLTVTSARAQTGDPTFAPLPSSSPPPPPSLPPGASGAEPLPGAPPPEPVPETEPAQAPERAPVSGGPLFGRKGQWVVLGSSSSAGISASTFSASEANFFNVSGSVGVDTFVLRNLSIGIDAEVGYSDNKGYGAVSLNETTSTHLAGGVRFGLNVPLGRTFSWYPRLTLGIDSDHSDTHTISVASAGASVSAPPPSSTSNVGPWINLYAPLLVHPVPHFFVGFGPRIERDFGVQRGGPYDGSQTMTLGAELTVGGWWGGGGEEPVAESNPPPSERFGEKGQVVLTTAASAYVDSNTYSNSSASSFTLGLTPAFDYFAWDHVSIGADLFVSYSSGSSFDASGTRTDSSSTSIGLGPRLGVEIPFSRLFSLWPQLELGWGSVNSNATSVAGSNAHQRSRTWVQASAPLLFHATTHFFVGAGPYVFHELSDSDQNNYENEQTTIGGSFLLGGWI
jgi:hypothetical protein